MAAPAHIVPGPQLQDKPVRLEIEMYSKTTAPHVRFILYAHQPRHGLGFNRLRQ
jgi:hypothetical protein